MGEPEGTGEFLPTPRWPIHLRDGARVVVTGGRFEGYEGTVVTRRPDLRPGTAWVRLDGLDDRLVPSFRLMPVTDAGLVPDRTAGLDLG
jgi:hypothetical protein